MLVFLHAVLHSWRHGEPASSNPWGAKTLEWQVPTPVPLENFAVLPVVTSDFYGYGEEQDDVVADRDADRVLVGDGPAVTEVDTESVATGGESA